MPKTAKQVITHEPQEGRRYRCRPLTLNPFGTLDAPIYSDDLAEVDSIAAQCAEAGIRSAVEQFRSGGYGPVQRRQPIMVADLIADGRAVRDTSGRALISPEGQAAIYETMRIVPAA